MRIAYDHQVFGFQQYGGISRYYYELAKGVSLDRRFRAAVIAPVYVNRYLTQHPESLRVVGVPVQWIPGAGRITRRVNALFAKRLLARFDPAIVHETYYSIERSAPAKSKVVLTIYDMIHEKFSHEFPHLDLTSRAKVAAAARADHIVCISKNTQRDVIDMLRVPPEKTSVVYLGCSLMPHPGGRKVTFDKPFLLYVGYRAGYKNFRALLRAYARSPLLGREFLLICFGGGTFRDDELRQMEELGLQRQNVRYVSGGDDLLAELYASAAALVYPSLYEGFGMPPLEAMSMGCPVVCSNAASLPEVVGEAAELFNPIEEDDIAAAIERVVASKERRRALVARGEDRSAMFSWQRCVAETATIYEERLGVAR